VLQRARIPSASMGAWWNGSGGVHAAAHEAQGRGAGGLVDSDVDVRWTASASDDESAATACGGLIGGQYSTPVRFGGAASIRSMGSALAGIET
jgi:hypothetical protein